MAPKRQQSWSEAVKGSKPISSLAYSPSRRACSRSTRGYKRRFPCLICEEFSNLRLSDIIEAWGHGFDLDVHLAVAIEGYGDFKLPKSGLSGKTRLVVWIHSNIGEADGSSPENHYSGLAPPFDPDTPEAESGGARMVEPRDRHQ